LKREKLEEAVVISLDYLNAGSCTATYEVAKERVKKLDSRWVLQALHTTVSGNTI